MAGSDQASAALEPLGGSLLRQVFGILSLVVMGILFFAVLTPVGLVMRLAGRDPLRLRFAPQQPSYWVARNSPDGRQTSMKRQF
jgi:Saxitoxin biosynthesis operon protein SxtJ